MATRKNRTAKGSKGRKNRTQKGGFVGAIKRIFGFSNNKESNSDSNQNGNGSQSQQQNQQNQNAGSDNIPELKFGGKKKRGCRNK